jgi:hypothetical protein
MDPGNRLVPRESAVYREFARLYRIARMLRPTSVDRWNGELYATHGELWGGVNPATGAIRLSAQHVLPYLTGSTSHSHPGEQAEALATVLHEATHTGMELKAPSEPNAVYSAHSRGLMEGVAELRAMTDFDAFADRGGYPDLALPRPQYKGGYAATDSLLDQAAGLNLNRKRLLNELVSGPGVTHFDRLSAGVVRNRLWDVVPHHQDHQRAARAALIEPMLHTVWPDLPEHSTTTGDRVADEIRMDLNAKVDEIRRHYHNSPRIPFDAEPPNLQAVRGPGRGGDVESASLVDLPRQRTQQAQADLAANLRFLTAQPSASFATRSRPSLGAGSRTRPGTSHSSQTTGPRNRDGRT